MRASPETGVVIRPYDRSDERSWLECRVLSFLQTAYFDDVQRVKPHYDNPSIELVAELHGRIVGLIDVECEETPGSVCFRGENLGGVIWAVGVLPEHQRQGVAKGLFLAAQALAREMNVARLEAWTRDDPGAVSWYEGMGFKPIYSYLHVYIDGVAEIEAAVTSNIDGLRVVKSFGHYTGTNRAEIEGRFKRVHECQLYERKIL
jgi:ribosomal protein S18 acetylase RimI-like enzyme